MQKNVSLYLNKHSLTGDGGEMHDGKPNTGKQRQV